MLHWINWLHTESLFQLNYVFCEYSPKQLSYFQCVILCTCGTFRQLGKQPPLPYIFWVPQSFRKLYVNNHKASPLQIIKYLGILIKHAWVQMWGAEALYPLPPFPLKMMHYLFEFFKPCAKVWLHHVPAVNVGPAHIGAYAYELLSWPPISFTTLWFVRLFSFQNHLWYVHGAKHSYHGWKPQDICTLCQQISYFMLMCKMQSHQEFHTRN